MRHITCPDRLRAVLVTLAFSIAAILPSSAAAQAAAAAPPGEKEMKKGEDSPIILSPFSVEGKKDNGWSAQNTMLGSRTAQELLDLPSSIAIINKELIMDLGAYKGSDVIGYGVSGVVRNQVYLEDVTIRGFRTQFPLRNGTAKFGYLRNSMYDVERVEVLKGPAAMLLGDDTFLGGGVNYITRQPTREQAGAISLSFGSQNLRQLSINESGPIKKSEKFTALYRLTLGGLSGDGFRKVDHTWDRFLGGAVALYFGQTTKVDMNFYRYLDDTGIDRSDFLDNTRSFVGGKAYLNPLSTYSFSNAKASDTVYRTDESYINVTVTTRLTDNSDLRFYGSYVKYHNEGAAVIGNATLFPDNHTLTISSSQQYFVDKHSAMQVDYLHRYEGKYLKNNLTIGGDYYSVDQLGGGGSLVQPFTVDALFPTAHLSNTYLVAGRRSPNGNLSKLNNASYTYYWQDQIKVFGDKLSVVGGLRWFNPEEFNTTLISGGVDVNPPNGTATKAIKKNTRGSKYGLVYKPFSTLSFYATSAINTIPLVGFASRTGPLGVVLTPLLDQEGKLTEFGMKTNHKFSNGFSAYGTLAIFDMELTNVRTFKTNPDGTTDVFQSQKNTSKGTELDLGLRYEVTDGIFDALITYMQQKTLDAATLKTAVSAPKDSNSILLKYQATKGMLKGWRVGAGSKDEGLKLQRAYLIDEPRTYIAFTGYTINKHWDVQFNVDNLTNLKYLVASFGLASAQLGEPRRFRLTATFKH
ncbi:MAG: TonB-dependent receptor [Opitutaceae bacterium]|nr:TonB-dependent receptor [Opitutaceae bacterium]